MPPTASQAKIGATPDQRDPKSTRVSGIARPAATASTVAVR